MLSAPPEAQDARNEYDLHSVFLSRSGRTGLSAADREAICRRCAELGVDADRVLDQSLPVLALAPVSSTGHVGYLARVRADGELFWVGGILVEDRGRLALLTGHEATVVAFGTETRRGGGGLNFSAVAGDAAYDRATIRRRLEQVLVEAVGELVEAPPAPGMRGP